jgi:hypothetical protein
MPVSVSYLTERFAPLCRAEVPLLEHHIVRRDESVEEILPAFLS